MYIDVHIVNEDILLSLKFQTSKWTKVLPCFVTEDTTTLLVSVLFGLIQLELPVSLMLGLDCEQ